jgi:Peptidase M50B-like
MANPSDKPDFKTPRGALLTAVLVTLVLEHLIPFGGLIVYPFTLLTTWVHETGHGLAALLVGGRFERLEIFWDASGVAHTAERAGWPAAIVCLGGLLAPPLVGMAILLLARGPRRATFMLGGLALALVVSLALWVRSPAGYFAVPLVAALIGAVVLRGSPNRRLVAAHFIALQLAFDTLGRMLHYVFVPTAMSGGHESRSDIALVADNLGGHYVLWGLAVSAVALGMLALGLWSAWRTPRRR